MFFFHFLYLLKEIRSRPVASGRVQSRLFIKRLWASQTSENIFYKIKVVPFEIFILKSVNKIKIGQFLTKFDPSNEACFFHFPGFTDF
jgi:hypothetical protein